MVTIYRDNTIVGSIKRLSLRALNAFRYDHFAPGAKYHGVQLPLPRIRYWPIDFIIVCFSVITLANILAFVAILAGGAVPLNEEDGFQQFVYAPLIWLLG